MAETTLTKEKTYIQKVRALNDQLRESMNQIYGNVIYSYGVYKLFDENFGVYQELISAVQNFTAFSNSNDPHGEHDFGKVTVNNTNYFWKIDYFDNAGLKLSPDPSDPKVTLRVLTLMEASEH